MANEYRVYSNFLGGRLDADASSGATSLSSPAFAAMPVIDSTNHMMIALDPDGLSGSPLVLRVTAHTASATTVTVDATGSEGTTARALKAGTDWVNSSLISDAKPTTRFVNRSAGDITVNTPGSTWQEFAAETGGPGTGLFDLTLATEVGDVVEAIFTALISNNAVGVYLDVKTMVSGSPVNSFVAQGATVTTGPPYGPWYGHTSVFTSLGSGLRYRIVSGDIASGLTTFRPYTATLSATNKIIHAGTDTMFQFTVKNLGKA